MLRSRNQKLTLTALGLLLSLCAVGGLYFARPIHFGPPADRAFYYWKTTWVANPALESALEANKISRLYVRFFDVRWERGEKEARPVSPLQVLNGSLPKNLEIVPVVYLVNAVFLKIAYKDVEALADNVWMQVEAMSRANGITPRQLQLDCDWTDDSRRNYFHFAELLNNKLGKRGITVSSTIRLHQIKYVARTGIPPVSRGMLMFYNFGRILADSDNSSIFNARDARRYTPYIASYKFPLDVVLPLFSWVVHSREGRVLGLLEKLDPKELTEENGFSPGGLNRFTAKRSQFFRGRYFMEGDLLLVEETTPELTREAADLAIRGAGWRKKFQTVALFDLDERNLNRYANKEIKGILGQF